MIDFKAYEELANRLNEAANTAWLRVTRLAIADIFGSDLNLWSMDKAIMELSSKCNDKRRELSNKMDGLSEEEYDKLLRVGRNEEKINRYFLMKEDIDFKADETYTI